MQEENDISVVDLLVVVLKRRYLIIGVTLLAVLFATVSTFFRYETKSVTSTTISVQGEVKTDLLPGWSKGELNIDSNTQTMALEYLQDDETIAEAAKRHGLTLQDLSFSIKTTPEIPNRIWLSVSIPDSTVGVALIKDLVETVDGKIRKHVTARIESVARTMDEMYKKVPPQIVYSDASRQLIVSSQTYLDGTVPIIFLVRTPKIIVQDNGTQPISLKIHVAIVMAAFFMSILIAFLLEYIDRVKADPESVDKIRKALSK